METVDKSKLTPSEKWNDATTIREANWTQKKMDRMQNDSLAHPKNENVSPIERVLSVATGAGLTWMGIRRRSILGAISTIVGGNLLYRGITGDCKVYKALGIDTAHPKRTDLSDDTVIGITPFSAAE